MKIRTLSVSIVVVAAATPLVGGVGVLEAQTREASLVRARAAWGLEGSSPASFQARVPEGGEEGDSFLGLAKWSTLAISAGASIYGFKVNADADDRFEEIEAICQQEPERCRTRTPDGAFADGDLEDMYQTVLDKDRNARAALILAQVGLATSIVLFVLDLGEGESPPDIPFDPPRVSVSPDEARLSWTVALPFH